MQGSIERKSEDPFQHSTQHSVDILVWRRRSPFTFVEDRDLKIRKVQLVGLRPSADNAGYRVLIPLLGLACVTPSHSKSGGPPPWFGDNILLPSLV